MQPSALDSSLTEGFDDGTTLVDAGWAMVNHSQPLGVSTWRQGDATGFPYFPAQSGDDDAYIAAD